MRAGTHVLLVHLGDPSKRPLLGSERSLELQRLRLADWGEERVGLAIADRVQVLAQIISLDLVDFCLPANLQEANGTRAG